MEIRDRIVASGEPVLNVEFEGDTAAAPGDHRVWREHWWPIKDRVGRVAALNVAVEDVTAERQRTEASKAADEIKDLFLAAVSHELRGPLNVIRGFTQTLRSSILDPEQTDDAVLKIERAAIIQQRLVDDLLDVTRIIKSGVTLHCEPCVLREVIAFAHDAVEPVLREKPIRLSIEGDGVVWADPVRLRQIMMNVLENAVKFTDEGEIAITVTHTPESTGITVRDTGRGLPPGEAERIFERFRQVDHATDRRAGLGLGLFIVRQLVRFHGGTVTAHSEGLGCGTTIEIVLPHRAADASSALHPRESEPGDSSSHQT